MSLEAWVGPAPALVSQPLCLLTGDGCVRGCVRGCGWLPQLLCPSLRGPRTCRVLPGSPLGTAAPTALGGCWPVRLVCHHRGWWPCNSIGEGVHMLKLRYSCMLYASSATMKLIPASIALETHKERIECLYLASCESGRSRLVGRQKDMCFLPRQPSPDAYFSPLVTPLANQDADERVDVMQPTPCCYTICTSTLPTFCQLLWTAAA